MIGITLYNVIKKNIGMGGAKPRAYCGMKGGAWCNAYVCYGFNQAGARNLYYGGRKVTYCPTSIKWCQANLAQIPMYWAMAGDVIYFDWNANNVPDHIGFVKSKINTASIATHEGNTNGGVVAEKTRPFKYVLGVFRPLYNPTGLSKERLVVDGDLGYKSIYMLQCALGLKPTGILDKATVKALQKKIGVAQDGAIGRKSALALQRFLKVKQDGAIGKDTTVALQKWCNAACFPNTSSGSTVTKPTTPAPAPTPNVSTYTGAFPSIRVTKTSAQVIADALKWGKWIAGDNAYHYGEYGNKTYINPKSKYYNKGKYKPIYNVTHSSGCHFCGTNKAKKVNKANKLGYKGSNWEHTYVCNTFVTAMYAHGGMESTCLSKCSAGKCVGMNDKGRSPALDASKNWKYMGKLPIKSLKAGDVLVSSPHMQCVYAPVSSSKAKIIEATSYIGNYGSAASNNSIRIKEKKPSYASVYRFVGKVDADIPIKFGEYSNRVALMQKFLNWAGFNCGATDGIFGENTLAAVKAFQKKYGLTVDGIFGAASLAKAKAVGK